MIQWIKGARIQNSEMLSEGYKMEEDSIESVLDADHIMKVIRSFVRFYREEDCFFFLEIPCNADEEEQMRTSGGSLHKNIYYLDHIQADEVLKYLELFEEILINDGLTAFGVGNHEAEIGKYRYNMVYAFSANAEKLKKIFDENGIQQKSELLTPWDIINAENPGRSCAFQNDEGKTVYDIAETLKEAGMYLAEIRED